MNRKILLVVLLILIAVGVYIGAGRSEVFEGGELNAGDKKVKTGFDIEVVAENLFVPWSIVFTSSSRILVTERDGKIREIVDDKLNPNPLIVFSNVSSSAEEGLMGLTLDPDYENNSYLYACYAYSKDGGLSDRVVRLIDKGNSIVADTIVIDNIPAARFHAGCRLRFGPDNKLYITTGDATDKNIAQDLNSLGGKILRINSDGSIPKDNPFPNSPVYSLGHRNSQGIDWHPETGTMFSTEHGPSSFDGPPGGDEVNVIVSGGNYGWPLVSHEKSQKGLIDPKLVFTPAEAPGSGTFYRGDFYFGALKGEGIIRIVVSDKNLEDIVSFEKLDISVGRIRDVAAGPDGTLYFSTSNRDGRADPRPGDDKVYRIVPD